MLGLAPDKSFTLERIHRTLAPGKQNRAMLVGFLNFQEKEVVNREARKQQITQDHICIGSVCRNGLDPGCQAAY